MVNSTVHCCWCIGLYYGPLTLVYWSILRSVDAGILVNTTVRCCWCIGQYYGPLHWCWCPGQYWWCIDAGVLVNTTGHSFSERTVVVVHSGVPWLRRGPSSPWPSSGRRLLWGRGQPSLRVSVFRRPLQHTWPHPPLPQLRSRIRGYEAGRGRQRKQQRALIGYSFTVWPPFFFL